MQFCLHRQQWTPAGRKGLKARRRFLLLGGQVFHRDNDCEPLDKWRHGWYPTGRFTLSNTSQFPWHSYNPRVCINAGLVATVLRTSAALYPRPSREENCACSHRDHNLEYPFCKSSWKDRNETLRSSNGKKAALIISSKLSPMPTALGESLTAMLSKAQHLTQFYFFSGLISPKHTIRWLLFSPEISFLTL